MNILWTFGHVEAVRFESSSQQFTLGNVITGEAIFCYQLGKDFTERCFFPLDEGINLMNFGFAFRFGRFDMVFEVFGHSVFHWTLQEPCNCLTLKLNCVLGELRLMLDLLAWADDEIETH